MAVVDRAAILLASLAEDDRPTSWAARDEILLLRDELAAEQRRRTAIEDRVRTLQATPRHLSERMPPRRRGDILGGVRRLLRAHRHDVPDPPPSAESASATVTPSQPCSRTRMTER